MIREYGDSDIEDVLEVWLRASRVAHPFLSEEFLTAEREAIYNVHMPEAQSWVCEEDGEVVGFIALMGSEVGAIFVDPEKQGQGIGRALMDTARTLHETLELEVFEANHIGRSFYDKYGFVVISQHVHEESGQPALRMRYDPQ